MLRPIGKRHPGFAKVEAQIGHQPGIRDPGAVLAAAGRKASPQAIASNPKLRKIGGMKKKPDEYEAPGMMEEMD